MSFSRRLQLSALLAAVLVLPACSLIHPQPAKVYQMSEADIAGHHRALPVSLRVQAPVASARLSSSLIAVVQDHKEMQVYKGVRWSSPVPRMIRDYLVDGLRHDGRINHISRDPELKADYALSSQLTAFQSETGEGKLPMAHIRLYLQLVDISHQRIVGGHDFNIRIPARNDNIDAVVDAFSLAGQQLTEAVSEWAYKEIRDNRKSSVREDNAKSSDDKSHDTLPVWNGAQPSGPSIVF